MADVALIACKPCIWERVAVQDAHAPLSQCVAKAQFYASSLSSPKKQRRAEGSGTHANGAVTLEGALDVRFRHFRAEVANIYTRHLEVVVVQWPTNGPTVACVRSDLGNRILIIFVTGSVKIEKVVREK